MHVPGETNRKHPDLGRETPNESLGTDWWAANWGQNAQSDLLRCKS